MTMMACMQIPKEELKQHQIQTINRTNTKNISLHYKKIQKSLLTQMLILRQFTTEKLTILLLKLKMVMPHGEAILKM